MIAVTAMPMTIAVTASADGIGSTAREAASDKLSAWSMIGAVPFATYPIATMTIWVPVPINENPMMIRRMLRCVSMAQSPIRTRRKPVVRTILEIIGRFPSYDGVGPEPLENDA